MKYTLGNRINSNLVGINADLVLVVNRAIESLVKSISI